MNTTNNYAEKALSQFTDKALSTNYEPFIIASCEGSDYYSHFIQVKYDSAKLIYEAKHVEKKYIVKNENLSFDSEYKLFAIVSNETIYFLSRIMLGAYFDNFDSKKHKYFFDYKSEINSYIKETLLPDFYDALEVDTTDYERFKSDARTELIYCKEKNTRFDGVFAYEVVKLLCGGLSKENLGNEVLLREKESYQEQKTKELCIKKCIDTGIAAEDWEIEMAKAVRESKAKLLTVEFEFNGKKAEGKITPLSILSKLNDKDYFCSYDFDADIHGQDILKNLGCSTYHYDGRSKQLCCENITKISYRGKAIYERK